MTPDMYQVLALNTESTNRPCVNTNRRLKIGSILNLAEVAGERANEVKRDLFYGPEDERCDPTQSDGTHLSQRELRLLHAYLGLVSEIAELGQQVERAIIYGEEKVDWVNVAEEIGDIEWYSALAATAAEARLGNILERNIEKLKVRFPEKFTSKDALDRDLDSEREVLEAGGTDPDLVFQFGGYAWLAESVTIGPPNAYAVNDKGRFTYSADAAMKFSSEVDCSEWCRQWNALHPTAPYAAREHGWFPGPQKKGE